MTFGNNKKWRYYKYWRKYILSNDINLNIIISIIIWIRLFVIKLKFRHIKNIILKNVLFKNKEFQIYLVLSFYSYLLIKYHKKLFK